MDELKAKDLQTSLDVSRPVMVRMITSYKEFGRAGLKSKKPEIATGRIRKSTAIT